MVYGSPLPVQFSVGTSVQEFGSQPAVAANVETTVLSYTVAASDKFLDEIAMAGSYPAQFNIYLNGVLKETQRIEVVAPVAHAYFHGAKFQVGATIVVKVTHSHTGFTHAFEATLKAHNGA